MMNIIGIAHEPTWLEGGWSIFATSTEFLVKYQDIEEPARQLIAAVPDGLLFKWGLRNREPSPVWTSNRVTLLGDAAHPMTPFLGEGACIATEDGVVLARALALSNAVSSAFELYEDSRKERANGVQIASRDQGMQHQGRSEKGVNVGRSALYLGLFGYNKDASIFRSIQPAS